MRQSYTDELKQLFRILKYLRKNNKILLSVLVLNCVTVGLTFLNAYLLRPLTDRVLMPIQITPTQERVRLLVLLLLLFLFISFIRNALEALLNYLRFYLGERINNDIQKDLYSKVISLPVTYFNSIKFSQISSILLGDSHYIKFFLSKDLLDIFVSLITLIGSAVFLFSLNFKLTIMLMVTTPVIFFISILSGIKTEKLTRTIFRYSLPYVNSIYALGNIFLIKSCVTERQEFSKFSAASTSLLKKVIGRERFGTLAEYFIAFIFGLSTIGIYWLGGLDVIRGSLTLGALMIFLSISSQFQVSANSFKALYFMYKNTMPAVIRFLDIMDEKSEFLLSYSPSVPARVLNGEIVFDNVTFSYDGKREVVRNFSCVIKPGEFVGLTGPNGAGKSTFLSLLCRFYEIESGAIYIDGKNIKEMDVRYLRSQISHVLQDTFLIPGTIAENIAYVKPDASMREVVEAAKGASAHDFIVKLPYAYDTLIREKGVGLSGGEKQRISISRALLVKSKILIFDEPTSNVDVKNEDAIRKTIVRYRGERTIFVSSHHPSLLQEAGKILLFSNNGDVTVY